MAHDRSSSSSLVRGDTSGWVVRFVEDVWRGFLSRFRPNPFTMNDDGDRHDQNRTSPRRVSLPLTLLQGELNYHRLEGGGFDSRLKARLTCELCIIYPEVVILLGHLLRPNVLHDHLVRHVPRTRYEEPPRPQVPAPALLLQVAELLHQLTGTLPLEARPQVARRHVRRAGDEQVDVVLADMTLEDLDLRLRTDRSHDLCGAGGRRRLVTASCGTW